MVPHKWVPFTDHHAFASFSPCVSREEAWFHGTFFFVSSLSTDLWLLTEEWKKVFITWPLTSSNVSRLLLHLIHQWARPSLFFLHNCARGATAWSKGFLLYAMDVASKYKEIYLFQTSALKFFFACQISLFSCGHFPSQVPFSLSASKSTPLNEDNA